MPEDRWERRPGLARLIRVVVFLAPSVFSTAVGIAVSRLLPRPEGAPATVLWWAVVLAVSLASLLGFDRLFRRLLPLSVLLDLALVFPGAAPSRFTAAFRGGTVRHLQARVDRAKADAESSSTAAAAATVVELVAALAAHDPKTRGHSERTRAYSELIAEELGLPVEDRERLRWSALLHDIGKLHVTPALLNKAGKPDVDEWETLRRHPEEGAKIAGSLRQWLGDWGLAIEQHHERFDGSGYPNALTGTEISLGGRIVAVADAYEVMTSVRSYTPPVAPAAAREELVRCAGGHFDPEVVRAFLRIAIGRLPRVTGLLVGLAQVPGLLAVQRAIGQAGTAVATGSAFVGLVAGGVISPGLDVERPFTDESTAGAVAAPAADGAAGSGGVGEGVGGRAAGPGSDGAGGGAGDGASAPSSATGDPADPAGTPTVGAPPAGGPSGSATGPSAPSPEGPSAGAPSGTAAPATTAPPSAALVRYFLGGTPRERAASPAPLGTEPPDGSGAPDYDDDGAQGRTLQPSPQPETTADPSAHQLFVRSFPGAVTLSGAPELTVASAARGFGPGRGFLRAFLLDCDAGGGACDPRAIATADRNDADWGEGTNGFVTKRLTFSGVDHRLEAGRTLVLRLGVQMGSVPLLLAYGTSTYPGALTIEVR